MIRLLGIATLAVVVLGCRASESQASLQEIAALLPASGPVELAVLPGPVVVLGGEQMSLERFHQFATSAARPLRNRTVNIQPQLDVTYADVVKVVDSLILGDCLDIRFSGSGP